MGKTHRNDIEMYFEWWLNELKVVDMIYDWDRESQVFELFPSYRARRKKYFKTKLPEDDHYSLLRKETYTYDYRIFWNVKTVYLFFNPSNFSDHRKTNVEVYPDTLFHAEFIRGQWTSYVDVKPPSKAAQFSGSMNSFATFPIKQRILLWLHNTYVNKTVPIPMSGSGETVALFPNSFTPYRFLSTDKGKQARKIKFDMRTLSTYVEERKAYIKELSDNVTRLRQNEVEQGKLF